MQIVPVCAHRRHPGSRRLLFPSCPDFRRARPGVPESAFLLPSADGEAESAFGAADDLGGELGVLSGLPLPRPGADGFGAGLPCCGDNAKSERVHRTLSVPVRGKPTVPHTALTPPTLSAICPWTPQHPGPAPRQGDTFWDTAEPARQRSSTQLAGHFRWQWQVQGSNWLGEADGLQTALLPPEQHAADQHIYAARRDTGTPPSAMRPCARGSRKTRTDHVQENAQPRTAGAGAVTSAVHPVPLPRSPSGGGQLRATWRRNLTGWQDATRWQDPAGLTSTQPSSPQLIPKREDLTMKHMVRTGMAWAGPLQDRLTVI
jgi:hypothetical protein